MRHLLGTNEDNRKVYSVDSDVSEVHYSDSDGNLVILDDAEKKLSWAVRAWKQEFEEEYNPKKQSDSLWLEESYSDVWSEDQEYCSFSDYEDFFMKRLEEA